MSFHDDPNLEARLRRIASGPEPELPASLYRHLNDVAQGNAGRSINGVRLERVRMGGRRRGGFGLRSARSLIAVAAVLLIAISAVGVFVATGGPGAATAWNLRPDAGQGEWTALQWHDITATAAGIGFMPIETRTAGTGWVVQWSGGFATIGGDYKIWLSSDGLTWKSSSSGLRLPDMVAVGGGLLVAGSSSDGMTRSLWFSTDGQTWAPVSAAFDTGTVGLVAGDPGVVAVNTWYPAGAASGSSAIYLTTDAKNWTRASLTTDMVAAGNLNVTPFIRGFVATGEVPDPNGSNTIVTDAGDVSHYSYHSWVSTDGLTWSTYGPELPSHGFSSNAPPWSDIQRGRLGSGDGQIYSTDGGATWLADHDMVTTLPLDEQSSGQQTVSDGSRIVMAVGAGQRFYVSEGDGHWIRLVQGGDVAALPAAGRLALLPNGVLWIANDRVYFGQGLSGVAPDGTIGPPTTPSPGPTPAILETSTPAASETGALGPSETAGPGATMAATGFTTPGVPTGWSGFTWSGIADSSPIRTPLTGFLQWRGGYVAMAAYPTVGGPTKGLWTSQDGQMWTPVTSIGAQAVFVAAAPAGLVAISVDPAGPYKPQEVWTSTDGSTWKDLGWTDLPPQGSLVSVAGTSAGMVATVNLGDSYAVFFSQDGIYWGPETGASGIQPAYGQLPHVQSVNGRFFLMGVDGPLAVDTRNPVFRLDATTPHDVTLWSDDGRTWTPCGDYAGFASTILSGRDGLLMEVNYEATPGGLGLARSNDGGKTWAVDNDFGPLGVQSCTGECGIGPDGFIAANGTYFLAVQFGGQNAWLSYDGRTWTPIAWAGGDPTGGFVMLPRGIVAAGYGAAH